MKRILLTGMSLLALAGAAHAHEARPFRLAQLMTTPDGCHWVDSGARTQQLWCRDEEGRARPTPTTRRDDRDPADVGCPRGQIDDGFGCVAEADALASGAPSWPPLAPSPEAYPGRRGEAPEVLILPPYGRGDAWVAHRPNRR